MANAGRTSAPGYAAPRRDRPPISRLSSARTGRGRIGPPTSSSTTPAAAEDVAQEAFLAAVRSLDRFEAGRPFGPWLHRIVVNRAIDVARARTLRREVAAEHVLETTAAPEPTRSQGRALGGRDAGARLALPRPPGGDRAPVPPRLLPGRDREDAGPAARDRRTPVSAEGSTRCRETWSGRWRSERPPSCALRRPVAGRGRRPAPHLGGRPRRVRRARAPSAPPAPAPPRARPGCRRRRRRGGPLSARACRRRLDPRPRRRGAERRARARPPPRARDAPRHLRAWGLDRPCGRVEAAARRLRRRELLAAWPVRRRHRRPPGRRDGADGDPRWSLARPGRVADARWAPTPGFRIAYREGDSLRVVDGDGTGDRLLARDVAPVAPAWLPRANRTVLAYARADGVVRAVDVDSGRGALPDAADTGSQGDPLDAGRTHRDPHEERAGRLPAGRPAVRDSNRPPR